MNVNRDVLVAVTLVILFLVGSYCGRSETYVQLKSETCNNKSCKCGCQQGGECKCQLRGVHYQNREVFGEASKCATRSVAPLSMCGYCDDKHACKAFLADRCPRDSLSEYVYQKYDPCMCCGGAL